ncbi:MAG: NAD(P)/FAD-dependent oxidoreductase [Planctomycetaceae bacterium]|nr:NAD(P)/FAD-dependent oxidoreductase [Planctomycetaceae bacterium]
MAGQQSQSRPQVVIIGGGFGGLHAARALKRAPVDVTLIDRRNHHLFQPLLYQVATGGLSPANIASPLRGILHRQQNCRILLAEATGFDPAAKRLLLADGEIAYDTLIVAAGARSTWFGHDDWQDDAPGLKSLPDAVKLRERILRAFEMAERETNPDSRRQWLTFVVVGGGPTGVEMAGALSELARHTLRHDFHRIDPTEARIILVDAEPRVLGGFPEKLSASAARSLERLGVVVRTQTLADEIHADRVVLRSGEDRETIATRTVVWAAGVQAVPLGRKLAEATGAETDRGGRVIVQPDLTLPGHPDILVLGDLANCTGADGRPLPGLAPVAIQQGRYAARLIINRLKGRETPAFQYRDLGAMATIGRRSAVATFRGWSIQGFAAWLAWLFIHLMQLVGFENRLLVLLQWAWNYLTFSRSARLMTLYEDGSRPPEHPAGSVSEKTATS